MNDKQAGDVKRWDFSRGIRLPAKLGQWVFYDDYLNEIEKLEAENRRLREYLETDELIAELQANETIKASQDSFVEGANYILKRWIEINNEALNSGGVK